MGVQGLATYLRENQRVLSKPLIVSQHLSQIKPAIPLVVDGWSFIYELYDQTRLPWAFGGEYRDFHDAVMKIATAWVSVGFTPHFVFDGPYPPLKFRTAVARANQSIIQPSVLFFRTSPMSRSAPRFMRENSILPPLCYSTALHALEALGNIVEVHIADEEGDPYAVELAGRLKGYVTGRDSDFVVLNADGYGGYIPMDELLWSSLEQDAKKSPATDDNDGFLIMRSSKIRPTHRTAARTGQGLVPPDNAIDLMLNCVVYTPTALANHFRLPVSLLPLLGALVGNDFTAERRPIHNLFFEHGMTASQRLTKVANTLFSIIPSAAGAPPKKKPKRSITSVMDVIDLAVETLLLRSTSALTAGERETIVEKTVQATLQYAIPNHGVDNDLWPTPFCALHDPLNCPLMGYMTRPLLEGIEEEPPLRTRSRELYVASYRRGALSPRIMDLLSTGTMWPKLFLENPDLESTVQTMGRPLRDWIYAILEDSIGLPVREEEELPQQIEHDDEDELIDVVEDESEDESLVDPFAPLRGALEELHVSPSVPPSTTSHTTSLDVGRRRVILEHVRRGTRLAEGDVFAYPLPRMLSTLPGDTFSSLLLSPLPTWPEDARFSLLLRILGSDTPAIRALSTRELVPVLTLRWVVRRLHDRGREPSAGREREKEKWTHIEARAFLAAFAWPSSDPFRSETALFPDLTNRNVQLAAQTSSALDAIEMLIQTLLLTTRVPNPAYLFSGRNFHAALTTSPSSGHEAVPDHLWQACLVGLDEAYGHEREKGKKGREAREARTVPKAKTSRSAGRGVFSLLSDLKDD